MRLGQRTLWVQVVSLAQEELDDEVERHRLGTFYCSNSLSKQNTSGRVGSVIYFFHGLVLLTPVETECQAKKTSGLSCYNHLVFWHWFMVIIVVTSKLLFKCREPRRPLHALKLIIINNALFNTFKNYFNRIIHDNSCNLWKNICRTKLGGICYVFHAF